MKKIMAFALTAVLLLSVLSPVRTDAAEAGAGGDGVGDMTIYAFAEE